MEDEAVHDWEAAANRNRDKLLRKCFGLEDKEEEEPELEEEEELELALTDEDCTKETAKVEPPKKSSRYLGYLPLDMYDPIDAFDPFNAS